LRKLVIFLLFALLPILGTRFLADYSLRSDPYANLSRFWVHQSADSNFFPTALETLTWTLNQIDPKDKVIIIGGSSVIMGVGQTLPNSIATVLQMELGPTYKVINLALRGGTALGQGAYVASALQRRGFDVLYISDVNPTVPPILTNTERYEDFFWQALSARMITPSTVESGLVQFPINERLILAKLNQVFRFAEAANFVSYNFFSLNTSSLLGADGLKPLRKYPDVELEIEYKDMYKDPEVTQREIEILTGTAKYAPSLPEMIGVAGKYRTLFDDLRIDNTLLILCNKNPYYSNLLSKNIQRDLENYYLNFQTALKNNGFEAQNLCRDFTDADYHDSVHLNKSGAVKFAKSLNDWITSNGKN